MTRRTRTLAVMAASFAVAAPVGYALAESGPAAPGPAPAPEVPAIPSAQELEARAVHTDAETYLAPSPSPELVAGCRERLESAPDDVLCNTILLVDQGKLQPGEYTNEEFSQAYEAATGVAVRR